MASSYRRTLDRLKLDHPYFLEFPDALGLAVPSSFSLSREIKTPLHHIYRVSRMLLLVHVCSLKHLDDLKAEPRCIYPAFLEINKWLLHTALGSIGMQVWLWRCA